MPAAIRVATYYRMSSDQQQDSIERQKSQVEPHAQRRGYEVVAVYEDHGLAGTDARKRKEFLRMLADAQCGLFDLILCDDRDRFARLDIIDYGYYVKPLRDAGVVLETVNQGRVDWNSFAGRISDAALAEAKKMESMAISYRKATHRVMLAAKGIWVGGPVPYGFALVPDPVLRKRLVLGDPYRVEVVRWIFRTYAFTDTSLGEMREELYQRGVLSPTGKKYWGKQTLSHMLQCRFYVGDYVYNQECRGGWSRRTKDGVEQSDARFRRQVNAEADWVIVPNLYEPLIDRDTFERCAARLKENRERTTPKKGRGDFLLTKLLVCAHCGSWMIGGHQHGYKLYRCGGHDRYGKTYCTANYVNEKAVLDIILAKLQAEFLAPERLEELRAEARRDHQKKTAPAAVGRLKKQMASWKSRLPRATATWRSCRPTGCPLWSLWCASGNRSGTASRQSWPPWSGKTASRGWKRRSPY